MFKEPGKRRRRPYTAIQVFIIETRFNFAVPIDMLNYFSCFGALLNIPLHIFAWPISSNVKSRWFSFSNSFKDKLRGFRPVKDHQQYGSAKGVRGYEGAHHGD